MNERNVAALKELLKTARAYHRHPYLGPTQAEAIAEHLAAAGVLVPSALTDLVTDLLDALRLADAHIGWGDASLENVHAQVRAAIAKAERIAKGEPTVE